LPFEATNSAKINLSGLSEKGIAVELLKNDVSLSKTQANENGDERVILFNLCGHGHFDMSAYEDFIKGKLENHTLDEAILKKSTATVQTI
jgi:hypothetical protein